MAFTAAAVLGAVPVPKQNVPSIMSFVNLSNLNAGNFCRNQNFKTRVVGAAAYLLLALMDHFEIDVGPPSSDLERPFEP